MKIPKWLIVAGIIILGGVVYFTIPLLQSTDPNQRNLDEVSAENLLIKLKDFKYDKTILIVSEEGDKEALRFATQIKDFLFDQNYTVKGVGATTTDPTFVQKGDLRITKPEGKIVTIQVYSRMPVQTIQQ